MTPDELADLAHLRRARDHIDRNYAEPLDVPAMARTALMSPAHFSRKFRAAYGETPYAYLMTRRRIERAKALLRTGMSVTDTCVDVGCTSLGSFSSRFTEIVGETPAQYRARDPAHLADVPACVTKVLTRPQRRPSRIGEASGTDAAVRFHDMNVSLSTVFILVRDPEEALAFYRDALGLAATCPPKGPAGSRSAPKGRTSTSSCASRTAAGRRPKATPCSRS